MHNAIDAPVLERKQRQRKATVAVKEYARILLFVLRTGILIPHPTAHQHFGLELKNLQELNLSGTDLRPEGLALLSSTLATVLSLWGTVLCVLFLLVEC